MKTLRFTLVVDYDIKDNNPDDIVTKAHTSVFEETPIDFISYLFSKKDNSIDYNFEVLQEEVDASEFNCENYFFFANEKNSHLCKKFGALCSNVTCKHLK